MSDHTCEDCGKSCAAFGDCVEVCNRCRATHAADRRADAVTVHGVIEGLAIPAGTTIPDEQKARRFEALARPAFVRELVRVRDRLGGLARTPLPDAPNAPRYETEIVCVGCRRPFTVDAIAPRAIVAPAGWIAIDLACVGPDGVGWIDAGGDGVGWACSAACFLTWDEARS